MKVSISRKTLAISACVVCCSVKIAVLIFGASALGLSLAAFSGIGPFLAASGWAFIVAAAFLMWSRNQASKACCAPSQAPAAQ